VDATARLFAHTEDDAARALSLEGLYRIDSKSARKELMRLYRDERLEAMWRDMIAAYMDKTSRDEQRIARSNADLLSSSTGAK